MKNLPLLNEELFTKYVTGREVVVVGGADKAITLDIRHADIVVRINNHWLRQGGGCDVLYHTIKSPHISIEDLWADKEFAPSFFMMNAVDDAFEIGLIKTPTRMKAINWCSENNVETGSFVQNMYGDCNPYDYTLDWLPQLHQKYNAVLFTGLIAVAHMARYPVSTLTVTGMNFYIDSDTNPDRNQGLHNVRGNIQFLRDLEAQDSRVFLDPAIHAAINTYSI